MFSYAQIGEDGYCIGISMLSGKINLKNMVLIEDEGSIRYIGRKYDLENSMWLDEYLEPQISVISEDELFKANIETNIDYITCVLENLI